ncbi:hypothetical protein FOA52_013134 [Chlamydomonas sp. UWO 241]|nr:hypothetical protein FOA52_013134 [Chlamydomonas sp. UWO 241]
MLLLTSGTCPSCSPALVDVFTRSLAVALGLNAPQANVTCAPAPLGAISAAQRAAATAAARRRRRLVQSLAPCEDSFLQARFVVEPSYDLAPLLGGLTSTQIASPTSNTVVQTPSSVSVSSRLLVVATNPDGPNNATLDQSAMVLSIASVVSIPTSKVVPTSTVVNAITPPSSEGGSLSSGVIAGIVIGTLLGLATLIALAWFFWRYGCYGYGGGGGGRYGTGTEAAFAFHDPRMIMWHNQLADAKQAAAGGGYQHYLSKPPKDCIGAIGPSGVAVHVEADDGSDVRAQRDVSKALARDAARFQTYAQ